MRLDVGVVCSILIAVMVCPLEAQAFQTLTEKLQGENPQVLIKEAQQDGDIVRGAILFHQGNIACAKCHRPNSEKMRLGPDLSRIGADLNNEHLVESILWPSKKIKEGYETVTAVTDDGRSINGTVVSENDQQIVIRDRQDIDKLITISRESLEGMRPDSKSSMPENLANELKDRQQFLDLLRYVIDVKERGPTAKADSNSSTGKRALSAELEGRILIQKLNCVSCHDSQGSQMVLGVKQAPSLSWSGKSLNPEYLQAFIADPSGTKPGTTMPNVMHGLKAGSREYIAAAITHFLASKFKNGYQRDAAIDSPTVKRGFELFHSVGCVACHSTRDEKAIEVPLSDSTPLGDVSNKYNVAALVEFLEDPIAVRSSGHMPNMQLTHRECSDIAGYLLQSAPAAKSDWKLDEGLAKQGRAIFMATGCGSCHSGVADQKKQMLTRLDKADPTKGCLAGDGNLGRAPKFELTETERKQIIAALPSVVEKLKSDQQIRVSLKAFNCIACHSRDDLGGVSVKRNPHFKTEDLNLGEQGRIPPTLTGVGAKLKADWMRDVMVNGRAIRPYMNTRMPQFGETNIDHLLPLLQAADKLSPTEFSDFDDQKAMRTKGHLLAGEKGLNCVACHTYKYKISDTMPAVDLTEMAERLQKDWFFQYMRDPQAFSPNTVMPSFWPDGKAIRTDIEGDTNHQIEALWQYLIDGRQAKTPAGVLREPLEIVVKDEAQMLRRDYPEIGKRGIGVGYPGSINLAYDAEQMRLALIWKGQFVNPEGVWYGQGSGKVKPLGKAITLPKGPELDFANEAWEVDDGRPPNHQFKGYSLDKNMRPTFLFEFSGVKASDFFTENIDGESVSLRRRITLSAQQDRSDLRFRIASGKSVVAGAENDFVIDDKLTVKIISEHSGEIVDNASEKSLQIGLDLISGKQQTIEIQYFWKQTQTAVPK